MTTGIDHAFVLLLVVVWPAWGYWGYAEFKRRVRAGVPGELLAAYCQGILAQWLITGAAVMTWAFHARGWGSLGFAVPANWHTFGGFAVAVAISIFLLLQAYTVSKDAAAQDKVRREFERITTEFLPTTRNEFKGFCTVSITAGICEEILFRGYLPWYLAEYIGYWPGLIAATVIFGAIHIYLGVSGAVRATLAGFVFVALFAWTKSLLPGVLLHAVVDLTSGWMAYEVLRTRDSVLATPPTVPAAHA